MVCTYLRWKKRLDSFGMRGYEIQNKFTFLVWNANVFLGVRKTNQLTPHYENDSNRSTWTNFRFAWTESYFKVILLQKALQISTRLNKFVLWYSKGAKLAWAADQKLTKRSESRFILSAPKTTWRLLKSESYYRNAPIFRPSSSKIAYLVLHPSIKPECYIFR